MPHIIVKTVAGRSEDEKAAIAEAITQAVMTAAKVAADAVSVDIVDVRDQDWTDRVYKLDILPNMNRLYRKPGYDPLSE